MPEVDITDAELLRRHRNGYELTREETVRLGQLNGDAPPAEAAAPAKKRGRPRKST